MSDDSNTLNDTTERSAAPSSGIFAAFFAIAVVLVTIAMIAFLVMRNGAQPQAAQEAGSPPLTDSDEYSFMQLPAFELVDQDGRHVDNDIVRGHYTIVEFMFSNCQLVCPVMKSNLIPATVALQGTPVRFVSFSVDPMNDTPEHLRDYANRLGIDTSRWSLLTGDAGAVRDIAQALGFIRPGADGKATNLIDLGNGQTMENIIHPSRFIVFDPQGRVVGMYSGIDAQESQQMVRDLKAVMGKP